MSGRHVCGMVGLLTVVGLILVWRSGPAKTPPALQPALADRSPAGSQPSGESSPSSAPATGRVDGKSLPELPRDLPDPASRAQEWNNGQADPAFRESPEVTEALKPMRDNYAKFRVCSGRIVQTEKFAGGTTLSGQCDFIAPASGKFRMEGRVTLQKGPNAPAQSGTQVIVHDGMVSRFKVALEGGQVLSNSLPFSICPFYTNTRILHDVQWTLAGTQDIQVGQGKDARTLRAQVLRSTEDADVCYIDAETGLLARHEMFYGRDRSRPVATVDFTRYTDLDSRSGKITYPSQIVLTDTAKTCVFALQDIQFDQPVPAGLSFTDLSPSGLGTTAR